MQDNSRIAQDARDGARSGVLVRRLVRDFIWRHSGKVLLAFLCMGLAAGSTALRAWLMEPVLDRIFIARDPSLLWLLGGAALALALLKGIADYGDVMLMTRVGLRMVTDVQNALFARLMRADLAYFNAQSGRRDVAMGYVKRLRELDPESAEYDQMAKQIEGRYGSMADFAKDLTEYLKPTTGAAVSQSDGSRNVATAFPLPIDLLAPRAACGLALSFAYLIGMTGVLVLCGVSPQELSRWGQPLEMTTKNGHTRGVDRHSDGVVVTMPRRLGRVQVRRRHSGAQLRATEDRQVPDLSPGGPTPTARPAGNGSSGRSAAWAGPNATSRLAE
jgi:hypothetical protein